MRDGGEEIIDCIGDPVVIIDLLTQQPMGSSQFTLTTGATYHIDPAIVARATKVER
jgi:hypothetical protein